MYKCVAYSVSEFAQCLFYIKFLTVILAKIGLAEDSSGCDRDRWGNFMHVSKFNVFEYKCVKYS